MDRNQFFKRVYPEPNTGCWLWTGRLNRDGYGSLHPEDNELGEYTAHRYSYRIHKGDLTGLSVLHRCDVRCCVNPDHLFLGTQQDNIKDMDGKKRRVSVRGEKIGKSKITGDQALQIKKLYNSGDYRQIEIASMFGIDRSVVSAIYVGRTWGHVEGIGLIEVKPKRPRGKQKERKFTRMEVIVIKSCIDLGLTAAAVGRYFKANNPELHEIKRNTYYK